MAHRRPKSIDIARIQASIAGPSSVSSEIPKSPRPHNFTLYSRHAVHHLKPEQTDFQIRTSLADLIMRELDDYDRCIFYQRVFILAKNVTLTVTAQTSVESILTSYINSKSSWNVDTRTEGEDEEQPEEEDKFSESQLGEISQTQQKTNAENVLLNEKEPRTDFEASPKEKRMQELDFFDQFKENVETIVRTCKMEQLSEDRFTGLFLCMGNSNSLFVLEGPEDTIALFCRKLLNLSSTYFEALRVFLVEDRIEEAFFDEFIYRRSVAMNINEKFPPPTANDPQLMGSQHWLIKEKLRILCHTLSYEIRPKETVRRESPEQTFNVSIIEEEEKPSKRKFKSKPKRKKRTKSPITAVSALSSKTSDAATANEEASVDGTSRTSDQAKVGENDDTYIPPGESVKQNDNEIARATIEKPSIAETKKSVEIAILKPPSILRHPTLTIETKESDMQEDIEEEEEVEHFTYKEILQPFAVNPGIYNRLLPEVQRIELVLTSKRFYLDLAQFVPFSEEIPMQPDEDALIWPTSYNYLPLNVFERLPYDVNLTFGNYDVQENEEDESDSSENDENGEKADKEDKKEG